MRKPLIERGTLQLFLFLFDTVLAIQNPRPWVAFIAKIEMSMGPICCKFWPMTVCVYVLFESTGLSKSAYSYEYI